MKNLLLETLYILKENNKNESDVLWVGSRKYKSSWEDFKLVADIDYDNGYGRIEVAPDLLVVGNGWWLERFEHDELEWWEYREMPLEPGKEIELKAVTVGQSESLGYGECSGGESMAALNNIKCAE